MPVIYSLLKSNLSSCLGGEWEGINSIIPLFITGTIHGVSDSGIQFIGHKVCVIGCERKCAFLPPFPTLFTVGRGTLPRPSANCSAAWSCMMSCGIMTSCMPWGMECSLNGPVSSSSRRKGCRIGLETFGYWFQLFYFMANHYHLPKLIYKYIFFNCFFLVLTMWTFSPFLYTRQTWRWCSIHLNSITARGKKSTYWYTNKPNNEKQHNSNL